MEGIEYHSIKKDPAYWFARTLNCSGSTTSPLYTSSSTECLEGDQSSINNTTTFFSTQESARKLKRSIDTSNKQLENLDSHIQSNHHLNRRLGRGYPQQTNSSLSLSHYIISGDIINNKCVTSFQSQSSKVEHRNCRKTDEEGDLKFSCCQAGEQRQQKSAVSESSNKRQRINRSQRGICYGLCPKLPSQRTMIILIFCLVAPLHLIGYTSAMPGVFFSGDESGEDQVSCYPCVKDIGERMNTPGNPVCNEFSRCFNVIRCYTCRPARLTECLESCNPSVTGVEDPFDLNNFEMLGILNNLAKRTVIANCEIDEFVAPGGCNSDTLQCIDKILTPGGGVSCSDDDMLKFLTCTADTPDCEWRDHIESFVSKARKSICNAPDKCITGGLIFVAGPQCKSFRMASLTNLSTLTLAAAQNTAPGTIFDTRICRLNHAAVGTCSVSK